MVAVAARERERSDRLPGFAFVRSDRELAGILETDEQSIKATRQEHGIKTAYKRIDTCAAEFESFTPYLYGTYEQECEADPRRGRR